MAVGDSTDIYNRAFMNLPPWFGDGSKSSFPVLYAVLQSFVNVYEYLYNNEYLYVYLQMRLQTATGPNLDLISQDYLGNTLPRNVGENDFSYRARIKAIVLEPKSTLSAMDNALFILTGYHPIIFEPFFGGSVTPEGTYVNSSNLTQMTTYNPSTDYPAQAFIDVYLPQFIGMNNYPWYNVYAGAPNFLYYNQTSDGNQVLGGWYGGRSLEIGTVAENDVYNTIQTVKVWGTLIWVQIHYGPPPDGVTYWIDSDGNLMVDSSGDLLIFNPGS